MIIPTVHRNGSSQSNLLEGYVAAGRAVQNALEALEDASPNARDYYVQGNEAFSTARREHESRCRALKAILDEVQLLAQGVADQ